MANSGANVLRWTALAAGIGYGIYHQSSITARDHLAQIDREYKHQASLIAKAKSEWVKKNTPEDILKGRFVSDPDDPKFDLEAYLTMSELK